MSYCEVMEGMLTEIGWKLATLNVNGCGKQMFEVCVLCITILLTSAECSFLHSPNVSCW